jgi:hypothetical protein
MEMGKIDQASICYKKAMASSFQVDDLLDIKEDETSDNTENDWQDYLMSFVEAIKDKTGNESPEIEESEKTPEERAYGPAELKGDMEPPLKAKQAQQNQPPREEVHFPCPACGTDVDLESGTCPGCQTTFSEEQFQNIEPLDDDLAFFGRIKALLGKEERFFIHFNGEDGSIRFLDKKETPNTKKPSYVFVRANVEELCYDYSMGSIKGTHAREVDPDFKE